MAGLILAEAPFGFCDRERVRCAVGLAGNLVAQHRYRDAHAVFVAALALAEGCLGTDDADTRLIRLRLETPLQFVPPGDVAAAP